ncbi:acyl-homoserine-lactone synthase [Roseovarius salinarum]|uniref:acyl-homoserine-lactone synthase n=1 Tax=Roseovarius salinarum TaxID=1981892 RepID=UPI000C32AC3F|nr:acyl-homoserine-lactone synthase [Roseovarius salinarum]
MNQYANLGLSSKARQVFPELPPSDDSEAGKERRAVLRRTTTPRSSRSKAIDKRLRASVLSIGSMHRFGELFPDLLRMRKRIFIDTKHWDVPEAEGMEFDQYDTPMTRWVVIHEYGEILAGIRLNPTTAEVGCYSYMLRDAQRGLLDGIPTDVLFFEAPVKPHIWEATRLFVSPDVAADRRGKVQSELMHEMAQAARALGAERVIGIVPAVFKRWMARLGMDAAAVGPVFQTGRDKSQAALMNVIDMPARQ